MRLCKWHRFSHMDHIWHRLNMDTLYFITLSSRMPDVKDSFDSMALWGVRWYWTKWRTRTPNSLRNSRKSRMRIRPRLSVLKFGDWEVSKYLTTMPMCPTLGLQKLCRCWRCQMHPNASTFSMAFQSAGSLYYKGSCIPEKEYFKKHDVAIVGPNAKLSEGTVVKLDRVETTGRQAVLRHRWRIPA